MSADKPIHTISSASAQISAHVERAVMALKQRASLSLSGQRQRQLARIADLLHDALPFLRAVEETDEGDFLSWANHPTAVAEPTLPFSGVHP